MLLNRNSSSAKSARLLWHVCGLTCTASTTRLGSNPQTWADPRRVPCPRAGCQTSWRADRAPSHSGSPDSPGHAHAGTTSCSEAPESLQGPGIGPPATIYNRALHASPMSTAHGPCRIDAWSRLETCNALAVALAGQASMRGATASRWI